MLYPFPKHDDMLDALSFILDPQMGIIFPTQKTDNRKKNHGNDPLNMGKRGHDRGGGSWMSF